MVQASSSATFPAQILQYIRPTRRFVPLSAELPAELRDDYERLVGRRYVLTAEILATGEIALAVEHPVSGTIRRQVIRDCVRIAAALADLVRNG